MHELASPSEPGPLHPATRLARVQQQLRSFAELHRSEIDGVIQQLNEANLQGFSARLTAYLDLHAQEMAMVAEELADLGADLQEEPPSTVQTSPNASAEPGRQASGVDPSDPAASSPKRARWLAEQANRLVIRPVSRRGFLLPWSKS